MRSHFQTLTLKHWPMRMDLMMRSLMQKHSPMH